MELAASRSHGRQAGAVLAASLGGRVARSHGRRAGGGRGRSWLPSGGGVAGAEHGARTAAMEDGHDREPERRRTSEEEVNRTTNRYFV